jgi:NAD(P)-dependent dehydrogenase (short-subunit alcohol dehydrogenase family)
MPKSSGLGYYTIAGLASHGAKVYMGARSESKAKDAIKKLHTENSTLKDGQIVWLPLDLANPQSVIKAAETVTKAETRLDILGTSDPYSCSAASR